MTDSYVYNSEKDKIMSSNGVKIFLGIALGIILACGLFSAGIMTGIAIPTVFGGVDLPISPSSRVQELADTTPADVITSPDTEDITELFFPFWEAWDLVHENFVDQPLDDENLMQGAIQGMMQALGDPHSSYMNPEQYQQANMQYEGEYEGIGAYIDTSTDYITIISTMPGSPAEAAGLLPGDQVLAVDGEDMTGIDGSLVIQRILGPAGTEVSLSIKREGVAEILEFEITRAVITLPSVESKMLEDNIAYIKLNDFGNRTTKEFRNALEDLVTENTRGLILDLRGNPGGLLTTSVEVASELLPDGIVLVERFGDGREEEYDVISGGLATEVPLVVLVNGGSASASEIVAGAIQDTERGILVGETTFGKGSVQSWIALSNDAGAIRVTIARWYTPNDRQIAEVGLTPDIEVLITEEDVEAGIDPQLEKAIEILSNLSTE
jgi:carboxyl-terminal processing protease